MASNNGAPMDYKQHNETYAGFMTLLKAGTIASALVAALVVYLIS